MRGPEHLRGRVVYPGGMCTLAYSFRRNVSASEFVPRELWRAAEQIRYDTGRGQIRRVHIGAYVRMLEYIAWALSIGHTGRSEYGELVRSA